MLIPITKVKSMEEFKNVSVEDLERKLKAIEIAIRSHTHNKFQNRNFKVRVETTDEYAVVSKHYFKVGDTVEISQSINEGLYTIKEISDKGIYFNEDIYATDENVITKIDYPEDIVEGALELLKWEFDPEKGRTKVGIASESESLSRHSQSTTYKNYDDSNTIKGYPAELMSFCNNYISMRY